MSAEYGNIEAHCCECGKWLGYYDTKEYNTRSGAVRCYFSAPWGCGAGEHADYVAKTTAGWRHYTDG